MLSKIDTALLAYLHELIIKGRAGMPSEIAKRLGIGERTLYRYLKRLKDMGAPLSFCRRCRRYVYTSEWQLPTP